MPVVARRWRARVRGDCAAGRRPDGSTRAARRRRTFYDSYAHARARVRLGLRSVASRSSWTAAGRSPAASTASRFLDGSTEQRLNGRRAVAADRYPQARPVPASPVGAVMWPSSVGLVEALALLGRLVLRVRERGVARVAGRVEARDARILRDRGRRLGGSLVIAHLAALDRSPRAVDVELRAGRRGRSRARACARRRPSRGGRGGSRARASDAVERVDPAAAASRRMPPRAGRAARRARGARSRTTPSIVRSEPAGARASAGSSSRVWLTLIPIPSTTAPSCASASTPATFERLTITSFGHLIWAESPSAPRRRPRPRRRRRARARRSAGRAAGGGATEQRTLVPAGASQARPSRPRPFVCSLAARRPRPRARPRRAAAASTRTARGRRTGGRTSRAAAARRPRARASRSREPRLERVHRLGERIFEVDAVPVGEHDHRPEAVGELVREPLVHVVDRAARPPSPARA